MGRAPSPASVAAGWGWGFAAFAIISFGFLYEAIKGIPLGTAYAVWTGIGAIGTVIVGVVAFQERLDSKVLLIIAVVIALIVGLKLTGE